MSRKIIRRTPNDRLPEPILPDAIPSDSPEPAAKPRSPRASQSSSEPHRRLDKGDLEAIASMDPGEIAALLDASSARSSRLMVGLKVTGAISRIGADNVFVDLAAKEEGMLERAEVPDAKLGDVVTAYILAMDDMGVHLSQRISGAAAGAMIDAAAQTGIPVEGKVTARNPGGFEVRIGARRGFCPLSQIDRHPDTDPDAFVGQTLEFRVMEAGDGDAILSRRALQEAGLDDKRKEFWEKALVGENKSGVVSSVQNWGVFVDMDGVEGLIPKRELSWEDDVDPSTRFRRGEKIEVRIVDLDHEKKKITLSARDPSMSPWTKVGTDFVQGGTYTGKVARLAPYGAFVELAPGLLGLLHTSRGGNKLEAGQSIEVRLTAVDRERQRLELTSADHKDEAEITGSTVKGVVQQVLANGLVVDLDDGNTGWLSSREIDLPAGTILPQKFRVGKEIQARVVSVDPSRRRVTLSMKEQVDDESWRGNKQAGSSLGTFADLLAGFKAKR